RFAQESVPTVPTSVPDAARRALSMGCLGILIAPAKTQNTGFPESVPTVPDAARRALSMGYLGIVLLATL
ncbi:unnamed protein product, partial [Adineta ricciae]